MTGRAAADSGVVTALTAMSRRLQAAFPDLPTHAAARSVHEAWRAAALLGVDTVEMIERLAREHLAAQRRRAHLLAASRRAKTETSRRPPLPTPGQKGQ